MGQIAQFAGEYFQPMYRDFPIVFADHVIDLAHNGGLAFNKGYILANPDREASFMAMLNSKRNGEDFLNQEKRHPITPTTHDLYSQGVALGVVPPSRKGFIVAPDADVPVLTWGSEHVGFYHGATSPSVAASSDTSTTHEPEGEVIIEEYPVR